MLLGRDCADAARVAAGGQCDHRRGLRDGEHDHDHDHDGSATDDHDHDAGRGPGRHGSMPREWDRRRRGGRFCLGFHPVRLTRDRFCCRWR
jgi:hypothetical protein